MIGINLLVRLAKLSFPIFGVLFVLKLLPIRIANSLTLIQNSVDKPLDNNLVSRKKKTSAPAAPNPTEPPVSTNGEQPPRGPCDNNMKKSLTALLPEEAVKNKVLISQENTKFWFYNPYEPKSIKEVELKWEELGTQGGKTEKLKLPRPKMPGIISISVPPQTAPLKDGKQYNLTLTLRIACSDGNAQVKPDRLSFRVKMHKLTPSQKNEFNQATTATQKVNFYIQNKLWLDALTATAQLKRTNSQDQNWSAIICDKFNLDQSITSKPIIDCCNPSNP
ncbi:protein of unknown function (DUF928) [Rivularia sp. PCC 7116]|uniref:DUF928 domain-containing protein n=1 Tax=Rivularia sp. PCC 7116 TaxID=373994 RepID=UPI00029EC97B|nr:DUF928 domain-containing protein [Rivularia sp. PCC 7116]AFY57415.1 protein of unknown function (DUF928) [Rivularia sp. PCC 7116]